MMEEVVQLRLHEDRQELFDYDKPDFIPQNIASIQWRSQSKCDARAQHKDPNTIPCIHFRLCLMHGLIQSFTLF